MTADLHCHTNASDAFLTRKDLLDLASARGVACIAITDHDTMLNSYSCPDDPVRVVEGCELSAYDSSTGRRVHILCFMPKKLEELYRRFSYMQSERKRVGAMMLERVNKLYPIITPERVARYSVVSGITHKQDIMNVFIDFGYTKEIFGDLYKELFSRNGGSCLVNPTYPDVFELLEAVRESRGILVAAHPSVYDSVGTVTELARRGLIDGIEISHPRNKKEDMPALLELCERYSLIATGGSDYHAANNSSRVLVGDYTTDDKNLERLFELNERK